ncbi:hypothetical protein SAMN05216386_2409 [Nitrosospira briensis]|uniref:Uncharacterized protein n=1 Tax=Nitrosospira briensis TaxID=35799 RepID=A0A1I5DUN1_9PROT|nr:hypothetical protein SAMN05216386_2409 [Nitrosospira briensis]SFO36965.1 hypothetical protein SAMN05216332_11255 [Nitrosospira briensis]
MGMALIALQLAASKRRSPTPRWGQKGEKSHFGFLSYANAGNNDYIGHTCTFAICQSNKISLGLMPKDNI